MWPHGHNAIMRYTKSLTPSPTVAKSEASFATSEVSERREVDDSHGC